MFRNRERGSVLFDGLADKDQRRGVRCERLGRKIEQIEPCCEPTLVGGADVASDHHRNVADHSGTHKPAHDLARGVAPHVEGKGRTAIHQGGPLDVERGATSAVRGDEADVAGDAAKRQREAGRGRGGAGGRDAGADMDGVARFTKRGHFLGGATEDRRVAAFQAHHALAGCGGIDEQRIDRPLVLRVTARTLADADAHGARGDEIENAVANQCVMKDDVGGLDQAHRFHRQQLGIARPGADQPHRAGRKVVMRHGFSPRR